MKNDLKTRRLARQQTAALRTLFRTSEALGEKTTVRIRGKGYTELLRHTKRKARDGERE
jgi:hypothetical protein